MVGAKRSVKVCFVSFTIQYKSFHTGRGMSTSNDEISNCCARRLQPPCIWSMDDVGDLFSLMVGAKRSVEVCFVSFTIQYKSFHTGQGMSTSNKGYEASSASGCRALMLNIILRCWLMKCPHVDTTAAATPTVVSCWRLLGCHQSGGGGQRHY